MSTYTYHDMLALYGVGGAHPGGLGLTKELLKGKDINQNTRILDAACGTGQTAAYLAETFGCYVTALDRHPVMIEKAKKRFNKNKSLKIELILGDVENIPLPDGLFDIVLAESVTVFTTIARTVSEYARVLRSGGILLDLEMTSASPFSNMELQEFTKVYGIKQIPTENEWKTAIKRAGFQNVNVIVEKNVGKELKELQMMPVETQELDISYPLDPFLFEIMGDHQSLAEKYSSRINYAVYKGIK